MKRWVIDAFGHRHLRIDNAAIPVPAPHEMLVKVSAVSLNYRDKLVIESGLGESFQFPFVPASDMAGQVEAVGSDVARFKPGDRVIANFNPEWIEGRRGGTAREPTSHALGGYYPGVLTEFVNLPEDWLVAAPESLNDEEASTLPCAGVTAWSALVETGNLHAGQTVLVQGTGGVALFGLQIAKAHGAEVIITSGNDEKLAKAKQLGADYGINRTTANWVEEIYNITGDRGVDHILEIAGGANLERSLDAVAVGGRISLIGLLEGFDVQGKFGPFVLKTVTVQGISVGPRRSLENLVRAVDRSAIKPVIDKAYAFEELPEALDHLDRGPFGKVVVAAPK